jgi:membrane protein insertase Oxa1/YidC/SpoIIIJ
MHDIWSMWSQSLAATLNTFSQLPGFSEALAIIVLTLLARVALMPSAIGLYWATSNVATLALRGVVARKARARDGRSPPRN